MNATQAPLPIVGAVLTGLVVLIVVAFEATWLVVRHVTVMAHERAHAVVTSMLFRGVQGIKINAKAEGETIPVRGGGALGTIFQLFVGYIGPSLFGLGAAWAIASGYITPMLWVALFLLGILLLSVRRSFGWVTVIVAGGLVFAIAYLAPMKAQVIAAYAIAWLLLLSGVRRIFEIGLGSVDGKNLRKITSIPHLIWSLLWLAGGRARGALRRRPDAGHADLAPSALR